MARRSIQESFLLNSDPAAEVDGRAGTFVDNMRLPVHRWFRYSAGFSAEWVEAVISQTAQEREAEVTVFDPFVGSGTTVLSAERLGMSCMGIEAHPFVYRVALAKLAHHADPAEYRRVALSVWEAARQNTRTVSGCAPLLHKCYDDGTLADLFALRTQVSTLPWLDDIGKLVWLTLVAILRVVSHVGTAPWQYVLPNKSKRTPSRPFEAYRLMVETIYQDMLRFRCPGPSGAILQSDARTCAGVPDGFANLVITSPPYANNYDYADATRLEMTFLGEVQGWGDLKSSVRQYLMRSCSQHVSERETILDEILESEPVGPIRNELRAVCEKLAQVRLTKGGRKNYHLMVACYFHDMAKVWLALRRVCSDDARVCFVIGDSAPYGQYVPVIEWNVALAQASGFGESRFDKLRDRNTKWKNRKHRVPLQEGRLWING